MKKMLSIFVMMLGWLMAGLLALVMNNMLKDEEIASRYISELEEIVEANGDCAADFCDSCTDYHKIWGD